MASKGKKVALSMRRSARIAKAKKDHGDEVASALSHSPGMQTIHFLVATVLQEQWNINELEVASESIDSIDNDAPESTLQEEVASTSTITPTVLNFDSRADIQLSFRADLDLFLSLSPPELEQAKSHFLHQLSLITEAKALKDLPGGNFDSFIFFNKFPTEVQHLVWEQLVEHDQKVFIVEAFRTKTQCLFEKQVFEKTIVHFRCRFGEPDMLLSVCAGSREMALKHRRVAIGGDLPGFKGLIHLDPERDIVLLGGIKDAFSTNGNMKGVKKLLLNDGGRACWKGSSTWRRSLPATSGRYLAEAVNLLFPDLTELYVGTLMDESYSVITYLKSPAEYELVPRQKQGDYTVEAHRVEGWKEEWAEVQKSLGGKSVCPEVKTMWVLKR